MHARSQDVPAGLQLSEAETVALAYLRAAKGNRWAALVQLAADALADLDSAEATIQEQGRWISHDYARGRGSAAAGGLAR